MIPGPLLLTAAVATLLATASPSAQTRWKNRGSIRHMHTGLPQASSQAHEQQSRTFGSADWHNSITARAKPPGMAGELSSHIKPRRNHWGLSVTKTSSHSLLLRGIADLKRSLGPAFPSLSYDVSLMGDILTASELYFWMCLCVPTSCSLKSPLRWWRWLNLRNEHIKLLLLQVFGDSHYPKM